MRSRITHTTNDGPRGGPRKGSALIITVGTLALIAIFAVFYVTLGQADTRAAEVVERKAEVAGIENQFIDHFAGIIAIDRLATTVETLTNDEAEVGGSYNEDGSILSTPDETDRQRFIREATDYPYTDFSYKSMFVVGLPVIGEGDTAFNPNDYGNTPDVFNAGNPLELSAAIERFRFNPAGEHTVMLDLRDDTLNLYADTEALRDYRVASDPWLASSEPTFLGRPESGLPIDQRLFSNDAESIATQSMLQDEFHYVDNRDWGQISNLAPDGLSVNLFNLRSNFGARSGLGRDLNLRPRMSENRTLLSLNNPAFPNPTQLQLQIRATDRLHIDPDGSGGLPRILDETNATAFAIRNTPAWWTMNQRYLYFPADPSFQILGRAVNADGTPNNLVFTEPQTWATPDYPDYQYADADGDGFYDSRWFELKDSTLGFIGTKDLLDNDTDMRFFAAGRVIDLSARVNVNSATDTLAAPTSGVPAGATPAEIDLRRLLTGQDISGRFRPVFENGNSNINGTTVAPGQQRLSYAHIEPLTWGERQSDQANNNILVAADYQDYITEQAVGLPFLGSNGMNTGRFAYDAVRREIQGDAFYLPSSATNLRDLEDVLVKSLLDISPFEYFNFTPGSPTIYSLGAPGAAQLAAMPRWRRDYWHDIGGANIADPNDPPITSLGLGGRLFDLDDLAELLAFNGLNDDSRLSRLERVTQGRYESEANADINETTLRYGPLRANRPTSLERFGHDNWANLFDPFDSTNDTLQANTPDNLIDFESMALAALNPRTRLTTLSGAAPLRSRVVEDVNGDGRLSSEERGLTAEDARFDLVLDSGDPAKLFALYTDALAPYARVDATWNVDPEGETITQSAYPRMRTLAYGHRGSELALRISAHMAVNMADLYDEDDEPSAYTVVASPRNNIRKSLDTDWPSTLNEDDPYPWWVEGNKLDMGDDNLAPLENDVNSDFSRIAYNVYGLEPQPFITEVAVLTVYSDTPQGAIAASGGTDGFNGSAAMLSEDENAGPTPGNNERLVNGPPDPLDPDPPADDWTDDDITIRVDISPENPDLVVHVLAIQLTNPFDVPIKLSGDDAESGGGPDGGALNTQPTQLEDAKYYIEFNGHFFPLAEYWERDPDRNPFDNSFYDGNDTNRTFNKLYGVTLEPGESRVFYVSAHPKIEDMNLRWIAIDKIYGNGPTGPGSTDGIFENPLAGISTRHPFEEFLSAQFTVTDEVGKPIHGKQNDPRGPVRLIPFNPITGELAIAGFSYDSGGTFVDFLRTSIAFRNPGGSEENYDGLRQEVRLWRKMTVEDSGPFNASVEEDDDFVATGAVNTGENWLENDLLVDRMRDPALPRQATPNESRATLDFAVFDQTVITGQSFSGNDFYTSFAQVVNPSGTPIETDWQSTQIEQPMLTTATDDSTRIWSNTGQGITFVRLAGYRRPDHLSLDTTTGDFNPVLNPDDLAPRGLLPAWCVEGVETNYNITTPIEDNLDRDTDNDGAADEPAVSLSALESIAAVPITGRLFGYNGDAGGGGGTATGQPTPGGDYPGYFTKNLRKLISNTVPANALNAADFNFSSNYRIGDLALIPTMRRHPALKSERGQDDPLTFTAAMSGIGAAGNLKITDDSTPALVGSADAGVTTPSYMDDRQSLITNNSERLGYDDVDRRTAGVRLGDLLMPLGVGTTFAPRITNATPWGWIDPENFRPGDWTTVAEATAAALGLEPPAFYNKDETDAGYSLLCELVDRKGTFASPTPYDGAGGPTSLRVDTLPRDIEFVLDRGRIDIDAYSPFYNQFVEGGVSAFFQPGVPGTGDYRVGLSIPPAQRLLSMGQALSRGGDPLTTPIIGTVNINTAPDAVLRTIPGFATPLQFSNGQVDYDLYNGPFVEGIFSPAIDSQLMEWAPGRVAGKVFGRFTDQLAPIGSPLPFGMGDPFTTLNEDGDTFTDGWKHTGEIPAYLTSFRDRTEADPRRAAIDPEVMGIEFASDDVLNGSTNPNIIENWFGATMFTSGTQQGRMREILVTNHAFDLGRGSINGEISASERPGFEGTGRLLALSIAQSDPLVGTNPRFGVFADDAAWEARLRGQVLQTTLTRYGTDTLALTAKDQDLNGDADPNGDGTEILNFDTLADQRAGDDYSYTMGRGLFFNENPDETDRKRVLEDELADDILEELAILNGSANTIDTRSDFFAAWFVLRGYRESDVEGLEPGEPMTPTYEKRFMMVIDRSNVTEAGQMPKILLLREVPL